MRSRAKSRRPRVLLIGLGPTSLSALQSLLEKTEVVGLVRDLPADEVTECAAAAGVRVHTDTAMPSVAAVVRSLRPDCVVVSSYNRILPADLLAETRFINVHYAPLPRYRGRAIVNWAIINGERQAAISIHTMVPELDAGNLLFQKRIAIGPRDTVTDLYERLNAIQREKLGSIVLAHVRGAKGKPQNERQATYGCSRNVEDGEIDWAAGTTQIDRLVRALTHPYPGAFTFFEGKRLIIWRAEPLRNPPRYVGRVPGRIIGVCREHGHVDVLTGDGVLRVYEVQRDGEAVTAAARVIKSVRATLGLRPAELLARIQQLEREVAELRSRYSVVQD